MEIKARGKNTRETDRIKMAYGFLFSNLNIKDLEVKWNRSYTTIRKASLKYDFDYFKHNHKKTFNI
jgi:hypothetical protein